MDFIYNIFQQTTYWHHLAVFFSLGFILVISFRDALPTFFLLIALSVWGEAVQLFLPFSFKFEILDIVWNVIGGMIGIAFGSPFAFILNSKLERAKKWREIKKEH